MKWKGETADDRSDIFNDPLRVVNAFNIKESYALQQLFQKAKGIFYKCRNSTNDKVP